ncbi:flagellar P-ring family protein, partial [Vibrio parahaemolyticus V-223/04]
TK